jgi:hypothetical protein
MRGILSKLPLKYRNKISRFYGRLIMTQFFYAPIYVETGDAYLPHWVDSVTFRRDPDGTRFFLRLRDEPTKKKDGQLRKLKIINYQMVTTERGRYVYRKPAPEEWDSKDLQLPGDQTGGGLGYPRGERHLRGDDPGRLAGVRDEAGSGDVDGPEQ